MRTTLNIDNDVLEAAKVLARKQNLSVGQVVSQLLRKQLTGQTGNLTTSHSTTTKTQSVAGFRPFPADQSIVTNDAVNRLREAEEA